jgi:ERCC4-type nuclease
MPTHDLNFQTTQRGKSMPQITGVMIDSREPDWIKSLKFGGVPVMVRMLDTADIQAFTDDGHTLLIERKTPDDFLNTLKDDRLFPQLARMVETRNSQLNNGQPVTSWAYIVIEEPLTADRNGKVITQRGVTGWSFASVMGTILSIQEMGVFVVYANGANDFQDCILRLGKRNRSTDFNLLPPRPANVLGPKAAFLAGLPGIGLERVMDILKWSDDNPAHALIGLTDMSIKSPIGMGTRRNIRALMGLQENENFDIVLTQGETA